jgi:hypothetical protein
MFVGVASPQAALAICCLDNVQQVGNYRSTLDPGLRHDAESSQPLDWLRLQMMPQSFRMAPRKIAYHQQVLCETQAGLMCLQGFLVPGLAGLLEKLDFFEES